MEIGYYQQRIGNRFYNDFMTNLNNKSIHEYFNILYPIVEVKQNNCLNYELTIKHEVRYNPIKQIKLPEDILKYISSYIEFGFYIVIDIQYPRDIPFKEPKWTIITEKELNLKHNEFWKTIVKQHNKDNSLDWSPAINLEKDVLCFISRIICKLDKI